MNNRLYCCRGGRELGISLDCLRDSFCVPCRWGWEWKFAAGLTLSVFIYWIFSGLFSVLGCSMWHAVVVVIVDTHLPTAQRQWRRKTILIQVCSASG